MSKYTTDEVKVLIEESNFLENNIDKLVKNDNKENNIVNKERQSYIDKIKNLHFLDIDNDENEKIIKNQYSKSYGGSVSSEKVTFKHNNIVLKEKANHFQNETEADLNINNDETNDNSTSNTNENKKDNLRFVEEIEEDGEFNFAGAEDDSEYNLPDGYESKNNNKTQPNTNPFSNPNKNPFAKDDEYNEQQKMISNNTEQEKTIIREEMPEMVQSEFQPEMDHSKQKGVGDEHSSEHNNSSSDNATNSYLGNDQIPTDQVENDLMKQRLAEFQKNLKKYRQSKETANCNEYTPLHDVLKRDDEQVNEDQSSPQKSNHSNDIHNTKMMHRPWLANQLLSYESLRTSVRPEDLPKFIYLMRPANPARLKKCTVERCKSLLGGTTYTLYNSETGEVLMNAKQIAGLKCYYHISMYQNVFDKSYGYMGKLRANLGGNLFNLYTPGLNMDHTINPNEVREEMGLFYFEASTTRESDKKGLPRKLRYYIPYATNEGRISFKPSRKSDTIAEHIRRSELDGMLTLVNKKPFVDEVKNVYWYDYSGRVLVPSIKNFQLVLSGDESEEVRIQFGKVAGEKFNLDFKYPLSPFQAFCACLSSFDYRNKE